LSRTVYNDHTAHKNCIVLLEGGKPPTDYTLPSGLVVAALSVAKKFAALVDVAVLAKEYAVVIQGFSVASILDCRLALASLVYCLRFFLLINVAAGVMQIEEPHPKSPCFVARVTVLSVRCWELHHFSVLVPSHQQGRLELLKVVVDFLCFLCSVSNQETAIISLHKLYPPILFYSPVELFVVLCLLVDEQNSVMEAMAELPRCPTRQVLEFVMVSVGSVHLSQQPLLEAQLF